MVDPTPPALRSEAPAGAWSEPPPEVAWSAASRGVRGPHRLPRERSASWAAALGWLVPGLGQVYLGRFGAGLMLLLVIGGTFAGGLALTDFTCVDPRVYPLEFVAHALIGGPTAATLRLTQGLHLERMPPWIEVGRLYLVVAGFLNLVAICDALGQCWRRNARIQVLRSRLAVRTSRPSFGDVGRAAQAGSHAPDDGLPHGDVPLPPAPPAPEMPSPPEGPA